MKAARARVEGGNNRSECGIENRSISSQRHPLKCYRPAVRVIRSRASETSHERLPEQAFILRHR
jgi:hypothetical protein